MAPIFNERSDYKNSAFRPKGEAVPAGGLTRRGSLVTKFPSGAHIKKPIGRTDRENLNLHLYIQVAQDGSQGKNQTAQTNH
jgi:hypothetical protein